MSKMIGKAIGGVVNPVIQQVDVNEILDKIDVDTLLDRVDINRQLERVDVDRLMERVDINSIIQRSNLEEIVARSTSSVFSHFLDSTRSQAIRADQLAQYPCRCLLRFLCCKKTPRNQLPPKPGIYDKNEDKKLTCPRKASELAMAVQGRNAGFVSRALAFLIDEGLLLLSFSITVALLQVLCKIFSSNDDFDFNQAPDWIIPLAFFIWGLTYEVAFLVVLGRTIGKSIVGLLVVQSSGKRLNLAQACVRALVKSSLLILLIGSWIGLVRKDRRNLNDFCACTCVIYAWDTKAFRLREKNLTEVERLEPVYASLALDDVP